MSGVLKLAETLPKSQLTSLRSAKTPSNFKSVLWHRPSAASNLSTRVRSLNENSLGGYYDEEGEFVSDMSGILKLAEALPHSQLTHLRCGPQAP